MGPFLRLVEYATPRGSVQIEVSSCLLTRILGVTRAYSDSMRVTKYEHSALAVEENGRGLLIDPGSFTRPLDFVQNVDAVVITHQHPDHWTPDQLRGILTTNPDALVFGPEGVVTALAAVGIPAETIASGDTIEIGPFTLAFAGTTHAVIHESIPVIDNTGVLVNGRLFHPGDSFTVPDFPVEILAAPVGAPWLKIGEAMDYVSAVKATKSFPIHESTLSEVGFGMHLDRLRAAAESVEGSVFVLRPGEALEL
jgi:L-ascorbate metabolism protein UlaG (beta-lactamase superfamily)